MRSASDNAINDAQAIFASHGGLMRTSEALECGIHRRTLYWMRDQGMLETLSRGVYVLASAPLPENPDVAAVMRRVPRAVLCLVSALDYHGIGTQIPTAVQVALPRKVRPPQIEYPRIEVFHMSDSVFHAGIQEHTEAGVVIRVFEPAKTIADCFRYRTRIGLDVAVEALQEAIHSRAASPAEIMEYARIDSVESVIAPYLRAVL